MIHDFLYLYGTIHKESFIVDCKMQVFGEILVYARELSEGRHVFEIKKEIVYLFNNRKI